MENPFDNRAADSDNESTVAADEAATLDSRIDEHQPGEDAPAMTVDDVLERVATLRPGSKSADIRAVLRLGLRAGLPPGDMKLVEAAVSDATEVSPSVVAQMTRDEQNHRDEFGYVSTIDQAGEAFCSVLRNEYEDVVYVGGSLYAYRAAETDPADAMDCEYYGRIPPEELAADMLQVFKGMPVVQRRSHHQDVVTRVQAAFENPSFFDDAPAGTNLTNGFLKWDDATNAPRLMKHGPRHKARARLPVRYNPTATAPNFLEGLHRTLPNSQKIAALQEAAGAILFAIKPKKDAARRMVILEGPKNSGKSTLISALRMMVPAYAIASVPPEEWSKEYSRARLEGVILNIVTELGSRKIVAGEQLKRIVSCEPVSGRHPYGRDFDFTPVAWHVFATNEWPRVDDRTEAFERRVLAITFERSLAPSEIDGDFLDKVRRELPGIINWAAEGAARLVENGRFTIPPGHQEAVLAMQFGSDPVEHFVRLAVEPAPGDTTGLSSVELREALATFAEARDIDTGGWTDVTHARRLATRLKQLHGAERYLIDGRPHYRFVRLKDGAA